MIKKQIASGILFALSAVVYVLLEVLVGREYGAGGLGRFASTVSASQIVAVLAVGGVGLTLQAQGRNAIPPMSSERRSAILRMVWRVQWRAVGLGTIASAIALAIGESAAATSAMFAAFPAFALASLSRDLLRSQSKAASSFLFPYIAPASIALTYVALLESERGVISALLVFVIALWLCSALGLLSIAKETSPTPNYQPPPTSRVSPTVFVIVVSGVVLSSSDSIVARIALGLDEAGTVTAAIRVSSLVALGLAASNAFMAPAVADAKTAGEPERGVRRMVFRATVGCAAWAFPTSLILLAFPSILSDLFDFDSEGSATVLRVYTLTYLISAAAGPVAFVGVALGQHKAVATVTALAASGNILLSALLGWKLGGVGIAIATFVAVASSNGCLSVLLWKRWLPNVEGAGDQASDLR